MQPLSDLDAGEGQAVRWDGIRAAFVVQAVALATGVSAREIVAPTRYRADAARARQIAMYLAHTAWAWPLARVGAAFGRDRSTASHAVQRVEDLRDDRRFDERLVELETCVRQARAVDGQL